MCFAMCTLYLMIFKQFNTYSFNNCNHVCLLATDELDHFKTHSISQSHIELYLCP